MDYDKVMTRTGGMGRYQWTVLLLTWLPNVPLAFNALSDGFLTATPPHHCRPAATPGRNAGREEMLNVTLPWETVNGETVRSSCQEFLFPPSEPAAGNQSWGSPGGDEAGDRGDDGGAKSIPIGQGPCSRGWEFEATEGLEDSIVTTWELVCESKWLVPLEQFSFLVGAVVGCVLLGIASDRYGRRPSLLASVGMVAVTGGAAALSVNAAMFSALRFLEGVALSGVFLSLYLLRVEVSDVKRRLLVAMVGDLFVVAGQLLLPVMVLLCRHWRLLQGALAGPFLLILSCWRVLPESTRWLLATRQRLCARVAVQREAERNRVATDTARYAELEEALGGHGDTGTQRHGLCELGQYRNILKNILILAFTTFIGDGIRQCFERSVRAGGAGELAVFLAAAGARGAACLALWAGAGRLGRRATLLIATIVTGGTSLAQLALAQYLPDAVVTSLAVVGLMSSCGMALLSVLFTTEIVPTVTRGTGLGLVLCSGALGRLMVPVMDLHDNRGSFLFHVVLASLGVLAVPAVMLLPESKRKPLPDDLAQGDSYRRPALFTAGFAERAQRAGERSRRRADVPLLSNGGGGADACRRPVRFAAGERGEWTRRRDDHDDDDGGGDDAADGGFAAAESDGVPSPAVFLPPPPPSSRGAGTVRESEASEV